MCIRDSAKTVGAETLWRMASARNAKKRGPLPRPLGQSPFGAWLRHERGLLPRPSGQSPFGTWLGHTTH
eukprot:2296094-Lingulodinium_polyedra.AAC.1